MIEKNYCKNCVYQRKIFKRRKGIELICSQIKAINYGSGCVYYALCEYENDEGFCSKYKKKQVRDYIFGFFNFLCRRI